MSGIAGGLAAKEIENILFFLLAGALTGDPIEWVRERNMIRCRAERNGLIWEIDCRAVRGRFECYGRYPFAVTDRETALRRCNEINLLTAAGAMLLPEDGRPTFRTVAALDDIYGADARMRQAMEDNARAIVRYWGTLAQCAGG